MAFLALASLALACAEGALGPFELQSRRAAWEASEPVGYEYDVSWSCFCDPGVTQAVTVVVMDGVVTRRFYTVSGDDVPTDISGTWTDIEGVFDLIDEVVRQDPDDLVVEFDETFGYPRRIAVDFDERMADDGFEVEITAFRPALTAAAR